MSFRAGRRRRRTDRVEDELVAAPLLQAPARGEQRRSARRRPVSLSAPKDSTPTAAQKEMFHLALYVRQFEREFLPFLTEKQLKLDFKYSMDRDGFLQQLPVPPAEDRRLPRGEQAPGRRTGEPRHGAGDPQEDPEDDPRSSRRTRRGSSGEWSGSAAELAEDANGDAVKCLNCDGGDIIRHHRRARASSQGSNVSERSGRAARFRRGGRRLPQHSRHRKPGERACR